MAEIKHYEIHQLKQNGSERDKFIFMSSDWALEHGFSLDNYEKVYEGDILSGSTNDLGTCEELFTMFNLNRPEDFHGHSLSVSDLVVLNGQIFYTDDIGFKKIQ